MPDIIANPRRPAHVAAKLEALLEDLAEANNIGQVRAAAARARDLPVPPGPPIEPPGNPPVGNRPPGHA